MLPVNSLSEKKHTDIIASRVIRVRDVISNIVVNIRNHAIFWLTFLIGGGIGLFPAIMLIDWELIILSSLAGAQLIVEGIYFMPLFKMLLLVFLAQAL